MIKQHIKNIRRFTACIDPQCSQLCRVPRFILAVLVSGFLGIEALGNYSLIFAFVLILGIVSDFGLSTLLVGEKLGEYKFNAKETINSFNLIKIILSAVLIIVIFVTAFLFFTKIYYPAFFIGIFLILPRTLMSTYEASIRSFLNQKYPVIIKSANSLLQLALSYYFLSTGYGLSAVMICILIPDIITLLLLMLINNNVIDKFNSESNSGNIISDKPLKKRFTLILKESSVFFANNFLMLSIKGLNVILLGYFSTAAAVGIYSAGSRFVNGIGLFSGALFNSFYPVISNIKNDLKTKTELTKKFILYSFTLGLMITIPLYLFSGNLMELTFKSEDSVIVLKIFFIYNDPGFGLHGNAVIFILSL